MAYSVRIYRIGKDGGVVSQTQIYDTTTEEEAIAIGISQVEAAPCGMCPLVFEIYDSAKRLVLSYTSESRPTLALEHDVGKWSPVYRQHHARTIN